MKLLYTHQNPMLVGLIKSKLENEGVGVILKNDMTSGGAGELAPLDSWPEVWITEEVDFLRAEKIVAELSQPADKADWHCTLCGEDNDSSFEVCWRCQSIPPQTFD